MSTTPAIRLPAPAKLTLSLRVVGTRPDGYHLIDAEMVTLDYGDELEIVDGGVGLEIALQPGLRATVDAGEDNLVTRALRLAGRQASVRVRKRIPAGAGLGGGSANAAAVLRWAGWRDVAGAVVLGADVPFCLVGGRARVTGIGEVVAPLPFVERELTLMTPPVVCATPAVYAAWDDLGGPSGPNGNDLEPAALAVVPELAMWRDRFGDATGLQPRLAGSGSTWFVDGAFPGEGRVVVRTVPPSIDGEFESG